MRAAIATTAFLLLVSPSSSQDSTLAMSGIGGTICREFAASIDALPAQHRATYDRMATSWVQGFLSGLNYQSIVLKQATYAEMKAVKFENLAETLLKRCRDEPEKHLFDIALELYDLLPRGAVPR